ELAVDPLQASSVLGDLVAVEVAERVEDLAHPVELACDRVRPLLDATSQVTRLLLEPQEALGPARVLLPIRARLARMVTQGAAELGDPRISPRAPVAVVRRTIGRMPGTAPQSRGQVAPRLRIARVERLRNPHLRQRLDRCREIHRRQAP